MPQTTEPEFAAVADSGQREEFTTGSRRDTRAGKGRYDLIPPCAMARLARHYENGAVKYGDRNWEKGQPLGRYIDSAIRHLYKFLEGHREEDHLAAAAWNAMGAIHTETMIARGLLPAELDDLPNFVSGAEVPTIGDPKGRTDGPPVPGCPFHVTNPNISHRCRESGYPECQTCTALEGRRKAAPPCSTRTTDPQTKLACEPWDPNCLECEACTGNLHRRPLVQT
ncbi:MAG TPA: dATP/dGTP diphosphohydrolase domain-containing protein [Phycisphaerae bacterium]|nr:dATP/dGTP diphosphohydrolase domain-containing protein [Phycisphaerae bacterium]